MPNSVQCTSCGTNISPDFRHCIRCIFELCLDDQVNGPDLTLESERPLIHDFPNSRIGPYRVIEQIGEGGCGVVYIAHQEAPVRREVAVKVIKLGMDTRSVIARFRAEKQTLALMDHPNIARVFDAGTTDAGRPYFVMELVRGPKITDYCNQRRLPLRDRLKLFTVVCEAIQHAHQKGIIHRDIKPSNILVAEDKSTSVPKVIDFGIAKATQGRLTDYTIFTAFEQLIGTPAYMSPEQACGADIDTRTDIYSLGILLHELLIGVTPFEASKSSHYGLEQVRSLICEMEPLALSSRLGTMGIEEIRGIATQRQTDPSKLISTIRGDLDWIAMKAIEKDRSRRYETADALASDIQRYLADEPIEARAPSAMYHFQKLVVRNRLVFCLIGAVIVSLAIGFVTSIWLFSREKEARERAVTAEYQQTILRHKAEINESKALTEAAKSRQVANFLKRMLIGVNPGTAQGRDTTLLREILQQTFEQATKELKEQPEVAADILTKISGTYVSLGVFDKAEQTARGALHLRQSVFGSTNELVAESLQELARVLARRRATNDLVEAEALLRQAIQIREQMSGTESTQMADSLALLAGTLQADRKLAEAENASRKALEIRRKVYGPSHKEVGSSLDNLALILREKNQFVEAEAAIREALTIQRNLGSNGLADVSTSLSYLASVLVRQSKLAEAEAAYREGIQLTKTLFGATNHYTTLRLSDFGDFLCQQQRSAEAETIYREVLAGRRILYPAGDLRTALTLHNLATVLIQQGRFAEAETLARESLDARKGSILSHWVQAHTRCLLATALVGQGKHLEAEPLLQSLHSEIFRENDPPPDNLKNAVSELVRVYESLGEKDLAAKWKD